MTQSLRVTPCLSLRTSVSSRNLFNSDSSDSQLPLEVLRPTSDLDVPLYPEGSVQKSSLSVSETQVYRGPCDSKYRQVFRKRDHLHSRYSRSVSHDSLVRLLTHFPPSLLLLNTTHSDRDPRITGGVLERTNDDLSDKGNGRVGTGSFPSERGSED